MEFAEESLFDCLEEIQPLIHLQNEEIGPMKGTPLNPDWQRYVDLNISGFLKFYTCRKNGNLVGYSAFTIGPSIEHKHLINAGQNTLFIKKEHRGLESIQFMEFYEARLKEAGANIIYQHCKAVNDYGRLLEHLGYEKVNIEYLKRLY